MYSVSFFHSSVLFHGITPIPYVQAAILNPSHHFLRSTVLLYFLIMKAYCMCPFCYHTAVTDGEPTVTSHPKDQCGCNRTEYYPISLDEFNSTFSQLNDSQLDFFDTSYIKDNYTIVILSYKRDEAIPMLLDHFCKASHVHMILFVWQNIGRPVP